MESSRALLERLALTGTRSGSARDVLCYGLCDAARVARRNLKGKMK